MLTTRGFERADEWNFLAVIEAGFRAYLHADLLAEAAERRRVALARAKRRGALKHHAGMLTAPARRLLRRSGRRMGGPRC